VGGRRVTRSGAMDDQSRSLARSRLGAARPWQEVVVDGVRLAYDDEGRGPVLLCLHSIAHGARDYAGLRAALRDRYRVIALDWPGHGNSGDDREPASAARYAALLAGFVLSDVVPIGNSIGGGAALRFAGAHPERVRALVLVDSAGLDRVGALARVFCGAMVRFFSAGARGARWFPRWFGRYYRIVLPGAPARAQRERIVAAATESAPILAQAWSSFARPDADLRPIARALAVPVFVAWARRDRVIQLRRNRPAIESIPGVRFETFPGGHSPFLECPDAFMPALESFLASLPARDARAARDSAAATGAPA
jgi:pimeloyl-ACP methyl ester carboxylesterase